MSHTYSGKHGERAIQLIETWGDVVRPLPPGSKGRPNKKRDLSHVSVILLHQTAVAGGFGLTSRHIAAVPPSEYGAEDRELQARIARYRNAPYHCVYSPKDGASIIQWPAWAYMHHGNGGNSRSLGWAYDGKIPGDKLDAEGARESLRHLIEHALEQGCALRHIEAHRQHSAARGGDPGADIWRDVALPVAREFDLVPNDRVTGSGRRVPDSWGS